MSVGTGNTFQKSDSLPLVDWRLPLAVGRCCPALVLSKGGLASVLALKWTSRILNGSIRNSVVILSGEREACAGRVEF